ncbi:MAG TPA: hypothetical protein VK755_10840 [Candidatus Acidoferrales bacterium]|nr:hypothetical protein [Candidatus Acidoferrales bacterium]
MRKAVLALMVLWLAGVGFASADCKVHRGVHVVLYSTTDDPSVLIWDSRPRLREYYSASFDAAQAMLPHALLVAPGTHAQVLSCVQNYVVSPLFHSPDDAVGVTITSGQHRGVIRWVLGSDVRTTHH